MTSKPEEVKLRRLCAGEKPAVMDLFAGCGGLTLGFVTAGCRSIGGVEIDADAARSYALNFHKDKKDLYGQARDITALDPAKLLREWGYADPELAVDLLIGGPPCPTFTRVGRAKLREVHCHPEAYKRDPRARLYLSYLRFVEALKPLAVVMENVPDVLNWGGHNLGEEICDVLEELGYSCRYSLLNAASYGVPQMRERFFLIGIHKTVGSKVAFPEPTRKVDFPSGYNGSRQVALKTLVSIPILASGHHYQAVPLPRSDAAAPVTVEEAIGDLPEITGHLDGTIRRGARRFNSAVSYRYEPKFEYARAMRTWPGFEGSGQIVDHVIRSLSERDYRLFRAMRHGDDYPRAHLLAERLFRDAVEVASLSGGAIDVRSGRYAEMKKQYVPPYDPGKFPNKWRKMEPDKPARTLMAHLGKDSYSHIHYDSEQSRTLSVREAARLQSFPDGFKFSGTMNPAFRQIGNAVPPLLALAVALSVLRGIGARVDNETISEVSPELVGATQIPDKVFACQ